MNKKQIKAILKGAVEIRKKEDLFDSQYKKLQAVFSPNSYPGILEIGILEAYIKGVCIFKPELAEDISYFIWEAPSICKNTGQCVVSFQGKKYNACDIDEYTDFIFDYLNK